MTREFILDTLLPYKENPSICGINDNGNCLYVTNNHNKCAVGKHLIEGEHQYFEGDVYGIDTEYNLNNILTEEAQKQNIPLHIWDLMQSYHDSIAKGRLNKINTIVIDLEKQTNFEFPELFFSE